MDDVEVQVLLVVDLFPELRDEPLLLLLGVIDEPELQLDDLDFLDDLGDAVLLDKPRVILGARGLELARVDVEVDGFADLVVADALDRVAELVKVVLLVVLLVGQLIEKQVFLVLLLGAHADEHQVLHLHKLLPVMHLVRLDDDLRHLTLLLREDQVLEIVPLEQVADLERNQVDFLQLDQHHRQRVEGRQPLHALLLGMAVQRAAQRWADLLLFLLLLHLLKQRENRIEVQLKSAAVYLYLIAAFLRVRLLHHVKHRHVVIEPLLVTNYSPKQ